MVKILIDYDVSRSKGLIVSEYLSNIREYFSVEDKQQVFKRRFSVGYRPATRKYAITPQGRFEPRLLCEIETYLHNLQLSGTSVQIAYTDLFRQKTTIPQLQNVIQQLNIPLRDYQEESIRECLNYGSGIVLLPTSAGKTLVISTLCRSIQAQFSVKQKALILVPDIQLVQQTYGDFIEYGIPEDEITRWTGSHPPDFSKNIIIANSQILLSKKQDISVLKDIDILIIDEVHKCKASNTINKIVKSIPAVFRYGFTGTMPVDQIDKWSIIGSLGKVVYAKKSIDLRNQKYITQVNVGVICVNHKVLPKFTPATAASPTAEYEEEITFLQENKFRNETILKLVSKVEKNILIMVDRINHGEVLLKVLSELKDRQVFFVQGSVEIQEREKIRQIMEANDNVVCVAISRIFSTGVNIRNLHYVVFASIGKAKIKIIQSIGRSLRLHASKKTAYIIDIADNLKYALSHMRERLELYNSESIKYTVKDIYEA
jgi:superfamily II DNA or RNA helicase